MYKSFGAFIEQVIRDAVTQVLEARLPQKMPQENEEQSDYYSRDELCRLAHISSTTLWRMEQEGLVPKVKFGRTNLYPRKEINDLLASGKLNKHPRKP